MTSQSQDGGARIRDVLASLLYSGRQVIHLYIQSMLCVSDPLFRLTFRIFVVQSDIVSVVPINAFGADVLPHAPLVHSDL